MAPYSKSYKQARLMNEQAQANLPDGVPRRIKPETAAQFVMNDIESGHFYKWVDGVPTLLPEDEAPDIAPAQPSEPPQ